MLNLTLSTFLVIIYLVLTNPFVRFLTSETHVYLSFRSTKLTMEDDELVNYKYVKNIRLFRYGN